MLRPLMLTTVALLAWTLRLTYLMVSWPMMLRFLVFNFCHRSRFTINGHLLESLVAFQGDGISSRLILFMTWIQFNIIDLSIRILS